MLFNQLAEGCFSAIAASFNQALKPIAPPSAVEM